MNANEEGILNAAIEHLRVRGLSVGPARVSERRQQHADAWVGIGRTSKQQTIYAVEVKGEVSRNTLGAVVAQLRLQRKAANLPFLLVTSYVTPPVADQLVEAEQEFADATGNAYLKAGGNLILISGRKPQRKVAADKPGAFSKAGLKVLFAFIVKPELANSPYREIAQAAGVALGALPNVLEGLREAGHLHTIGEQRKLAATRRLLTEWAIGYTRRLRPKQLTRTFVAPNFETWRNWELEDAKWGGEPAAALITNHLTPGMLTIYATRAPAKLIVRERWTAARSGDERGLVEIRAPFWGAAVEVSSPPRTVPLALVYADLLATGEARCIETAEMVYEAQLARSFPAK